jgi:hypothetical protein
MTHVPKFFATVKVLFFSVWNCNAMGFIPELSHFSCTDSCNIGIVKIQGGKLWGNEGYLEVMKWNGGKATVKCQYNSSWQYIFHCCYCLVHTVLNHLCIRLVFIVCSVSFIVFEFCVLCFVWAWCVRCNVCYLCVVSYRGMIVMG